MLRLAILLEALCSKLSSFKVFNRFVCGMDTPQPNPAIQMTVKAFQILPPIQYKMITFKDNYSPVLLVVVIPPAALLSVQES